MAAAVRRARNPARHRRSVGNEHYLSLNGTSAIIVLDDAYIAMPVSTARQALLLDIVAPASHDFRKAQDVFARRLAAREIKSDTRERG